MQNPPTQLLMLLILLGSTAWPHVGRAELPFRVWAQPQFTALDVAPVRKSAVQVRGRLLDDAGNPLSKATIEVRRRGTTRPLQLASCNGGALATDADGGFCTVLPPSAEPADFELWFAGASHYEPASASLPSVAWPGELTLQFISSTLEIDIEAPDPGATLKVGGSARPKASQLQLIVEARVRDHFEQLGATPMLVGDEGTLSVSLNTSALPTPGAHELVAYVRGPDAPAARAHAVLLLTASVRLEEHSRQPQDTGVQWELAARALRGTPEGSIQITGEGFERTARLVDGRARLLVPKSDAQDRSFEADFIPAEPWWIPTAPLTLSTRAAANSSTLWPWLLVLLAVGYSCLRALERPTRSEKPAPKRPAPQVATEPAWEAAPELSGWRGWIHDGHDRTPIRDATVSLRGPALSGSAVLASTSSSAQGEYDLAVASSPSEGSYLEVTAPGYARLRIAAPPFGRLRIPLTQTRRDLLERLARLARWAPSESPSQPEPTPAELAQQAKRRGSGSVAGWAEAVERAAYAKEPLAEADYQSLIEEAPKQRLPNDSSSASTTNR